MKKKNKKFVYIGIIVLILIVGYMFLSNTAKKNNYCGSVINAQCSTGYKCIGDKSANFGFSNCAKMFNGVTYNCGGENNMQCTVLNLTCHYYDPIGTLNRRGTCA